MRCNRELTSAANAVLKERIKNKQFSSGGVEAIAAHGSDTRSGQKPQPMRHTALHTGQKTRLRKHLRLGGYREVHRAVNAARYPLRSQRSAWPARIPPPKRWLPITNAMPKVFEFKMEWEGKLHCHQWHIFCPGCKIVHAIGVNVHKFNGNKDRPTFSPSLLEEFYRYTGKGDETAPFRCHSYVKDGRIQFLSDCSHELKNQTIDLPEYNGGLI